MKILRGPRSADKWNRTDEKAVSEYADRWAPVTALRFDGTIDKSGTRHTDLGVQVDEADILALHAGLLKYYQTAVGERDDLRSRVSELETVLVKISQLVSWRRPPAASADELLEVVEKVAEHFQYSLNRDKEFKSSHGWWEEL